MVQKWPKIGEINRGGPPENPNESQKYRKNGPKTLPQCNMKMHQNSKNGQNWAKIGKTYEKNRFSLTGAFS